ncbi:hypothetical protein L1987_45953 [Smallanthus sonchifolius]|uniref:Uncharacterized protein n=1 Tax=Smallanthus sonchifolius TaxID=185202 RepID=A0ACB9FYD0_9ASTR|nr:hypothetical protein L1987_45953 [Smallanthus sonchifolius]
MNRLILRLKMQDPKTTDESDTLQGERSDPLGKVLAGFPARSPVNGYGPIEGSVAFVVVLSEYASQEGYYRPQSSGLGQPCEDWFDIYSNEVLVNRLVRSYGTLISIFDDLKVLKQLRTPLGAKFSASFPRVKGFFFSISSNVRSYATKPGITTMAFSASTISVP